MRRTFSSAPYYIFAQKSLVIPLRKKCQKEGEEPWPDKLTLYKDDKNIEKLFKMEKLINLYLVTFEKV